MGSIRLPVEVSQASESGRGTATPPNDWLGRSIATHTRTSCSLLAIFSPMLAGTGCNMQTLGARPRGRRDERDDYMQLSLDNFGRARKSFIGPHNLLWTS